MAAGVGILALSLLLLSWGLLAMQLTFPTTLNCFPIVPCTPNDVRSAVLTGTRFLVAFPYSIPAQVTGNFTVAFSYGDPALKSCDVELAHANCPMSLPRPGSDLTATSENYVVFSVTFIGSGNGIVQYFTDPSGNRLPLVPGYGDYGKGDTGQSVYGEQTASQFFQVTTAGNYTLHMFPIQCGYMCSTQNATGSYSMAVATIVSSHPFYYAGLATSGVALVTAAASIRFLAITSKRVLKRHPKPLKSAEGFD